MVGTANSPPTSSPPQKKKKVHPLLLTLHDAKGQKCQHQHTVMVLKPGQASPRSVSSSEQTSWFQTRGEEPQNIQCSARVTSAPVTVRLAAGGGQASKGQLVGCIHHSATTFQSAHKHLDTTEVWKARKRSVAAPPAVIKLSCETPSGRHS